MTPAPVVITAAPDTLLVIASPDVIDRLAVIAQALIDAHAGAPAAGDCAAAGKCLRRYPPPDDADTPAPQPAHSHGLFGPQPPAAAGNTPAPQPQPQPQPQPPDDADDVDDVDDVDTDGNDAGGSADLTNQGKLRCIALTNTGKRCMRARSSRESYCTFHINLPARLANDAGNDAGAGASVATAEAHTAPDRAPADGNDTGANSGGNLCAATAKVSGNRCRRVAHSGSRYCYYHRDWDTDDAPPPDVPPAPAPPADTPAPLPDTPAPQTAPQPDTPAPQTAPLPDGDDAGNDAGNDAGAGAGAGAGVAPWVIAAAGCQQPLDCLQPDCLSYRTGKCNPDGIPGHLRRTPPTGTTPAPAPAPLPELTAPVLNAWPSDTATATPAPTATAAPCPHCGAGPAMRQQDGDGHWRCLACARYLAPPALSAAAAAADRAGYRRAARPAQKAIAAAA